MSNPQGLTPLFTLLTIAAAFVIMASLSSLCSPLLTPSRLRALWRFMGIPNGVIRYSDFMDLVTIPEIGGTGL